MISGFLFDLDGTLVDSERESGEAMARALLEGQGLAIEQADKDSVIGHSWVAIFDRLSRRYPQLSWTRDELIAATAHKRDEVFAELGVTVLPGAREVMRWTRTRPRALVTGSSRVEVTQVLPLISPDAVFDVIFAAEDVPRSKPAPDGYRAAMAHLGLLPHECVVIEDSVAGIAAGRAAGCLVIAVKAGNFGGWDQSGAHRLLESLEEFTPSLIDELAKLDPRDYGSPMGSGSVP
ncbi:MAG: HAD family phosphatase [Myxococcales bacterium]|nr:HAD family phosphatase [Myxococcales bacterium]